MKCEIEFLPVGNASKPGDAIVVRYGSPDAYEIMVIDGGTLETGDMLVAHLRKHFGPYVTLTHVVLTHSDADHASGLRTVLKEIPVTNLWLHVPWLHASASKPYFLNKTWADERLSIAIKKEYDIVAEILDTAIQNRISIREPFVGEMIGPFHVLSPHKEMYELLLPQFERTPEPDQAAIAAKGWWIGPKSGGMLSSLFEKAIAKVQNKWVTETWEHELLKDGGVTGASNESSVVLYCNLDEGQKILLNGDAGVWALSVAAYFAEHYKFPLREFTFVQVPHHGSRRNVGPTILNRLIGPIQPKGTQTRFTAFVSSPPEDDVHPRKMVTNAFLRRGGCVVATQGTAKIHYGGFPSRLGYVGVKPVEFSPSVEEYD
ncbi:MAG: MBL fold metallo-hydrolase [Nitrospira sp.]|nr:MBL fold metallo-hydrolase [Nitrospira sp.]MDH4244531.1 MBL fold metallo-hydrolase [Nitrospira sp.]MDH4357353.1 MBL fold metallo-hydrolase [Nitrospira sp.]MDH5319630.1 MBL fold metallo-hydrolase [Nitrospira sp.]